MEGGGDQGHSGLPCSARVRAGRGSSGLQTIGLCYLCSEFARRADVGTFRPLQGHSSPTIRAVCLQRQQDWP